MSGARKLTLAKIVSVVLVATATVSLYGAFKPGYDVHEPAIRPTWKGAQPGVWTMDYEAALANGRANGKWTVMLYSGMWWCPHCQPLESEVLEKEEWKSFVSTNGMYLTALDFPYRDGESNFCWLWDADYLSDAGLTAQEGQMAVESRYLVQDAYAVPGAQEQTCPSLSCPGTTNRYHRIGYPTILMIRPDGKVAGRFSVSKTFANPDYVLTRVRQIMEADEWDETDDYWQGATEIPEPDCEEVVLTNGVHTLGITDKTDWFRFTAEKSGGLLNEFRFFPILGRKSVPLAVSVFASPEGDPILTQTINPPDGQTFSAVLRCGDWYLRVQPADLSLAGVAGYGIARSYTMVPASVRFKQTSVTVQNTKGAAELSVSIANAALEAEVAFDWVAFAGTASYPEDYAAERGEIVWRSDEAKKDKVISIPLVSSPFWKGDRSFAVKLFPRKHCEIPVEAASCQVTVREMKRRNAGSLAFDAAYRTVQPVLREGESFSTQVYRTSGGDGVVTGTVTVTDGALKNVVVTNLVWAHADMEPKAFSFVFPREDGVQPDRRGKFTLKATGAKAGTPNILNFIRRDELVVMPFAEYNKTVLGSTASVSGGSWFYGLDPDDLSADPRLRSDVLTTRDSALNLRVKGPSALILDVKAVRGAVFGLSMGRKKLASDCSGTVKVAVPKGTQTVTLTAAGRQEDGAFASVSLRTVSLADCQLLPVTPFDGSAVAVSESFRLVGRAKEVPDFGSPPAVETFAGLGGLPKFAGCTNVLSGQTFACAEAAMLSPLMVAGKTLQWRMDVVYADGFGNRAVVAGKLAKVKLVAADAPSADETTGAPEGWQLTDEGVYVCPQLTVGVTADIGPIPLKNVPEGSTVQVSRLGGKLPSGIKAWVAADGIRLSGVPSKEGPFSFDLALVANVPTGMRSMKVNGASIRIEGSVEPLGDAVGTYNGYRMHIEPSSFRAGAGGAKLTIAKGGSISGNMCLGGSNFTFRASAFSSREDETFFVNCLTAKCGRAVCPMSVRIVRGQGDEETKDAEIVLDGDDGFWLYRNDWTSPERKAQAKTVSGTYTAELPVIAGQPHSVAPSAAGYLKATVKDSGTVTYAGVGPAGESFSGTSPLFRIWDCCTGSGWLMVFYVNVNKSGANGSGAYGLVAVTPDESTPAVRYLSAADDGMLTFFNRSPKSIFGYSAWQATADVLGGSYDGTAGFPDDGCWTLAGPLAVFDDYDGRTGDSGFRVGPVPAAGDLTLRSFSTASARLVANEWDARFGSFSRSAGTFSMRIPLKYSNGRETKNRQLAVKGVYVQHSQTGSFWTGLYSLPEKVPSVPEGGPGTPYNVNTFFSLKFK